MPSKVPEPQKYDPWEAKQEIADVKIVVHCCRYWMLSEWECVNMSYPFWRIYHSRIGGAYVCFENKKVDLAPNKLVLIPPHTPFSTHLKHTQPALHESIKGVRIQHENEIIRYKSQEMTDQLFIHFNLGFPYDRIKPDVYEITINPFLEELIYDIQRNRLVAPSLINFQSNMKVNALILLALEHVPYECWNTDGIDTRILKIVDYIDKNISNPLNNTELSSISNLTSNSFARLFKENMKQPVQQYIQQRRIEHAINLLHHTNIQIEEIAAESGFYDRHHFSRVFKKAIGIPPANYRREIVKIH